MFTVEILNQNGRKIDADDYIKDAGDALCCPDPMCSAGMTYVSKSQEMATFNRAPHFRTKKGEKHVEGCEAHREEKEFKRRLDSMRDAIRDNKKVVLSLNDAETLYGLPKNLGQTFNSRSDPAYAHTDLYAFEKEHRGKYVSQSVKKIRTLMTMISLLDAEFGPPAFNHVYFAWQGQVKPYADCICGTKDDALKLARDLYQQAGDAKNPYRFEKYGHIGAYGFPRIIEFTPSSSAYVGHKKMIFGEQTQIDYHGDHKSRLFLTHAIDIAKLPEDARARVLNRQSVRLIAVPKVNRTMVDKTVNDFRAGTSGSIRVTWTVCGDHQVQSLNPDQRMSSPMPARPKGKQLALL